ncbi:MAG: RCC1-like G exchanging factor-like protein [Hyperionvirus sp.]|uniref:RCC1-like G exchanging factor-like protein n=1 Tax=Hyperionvirus sp. TaxID=2487770 RepID=A0A3G5A7V7_9VIRU|nr:MAG: RCC1-like G exchanging factor-like protein [Hyperionvirus sp.]
MRLAQMDLISLFGNLIPDIQYIIINYYHGSLYVLGESESKYDWFRLVKENFGQTYSREIYCEYDLNKIYLANCWEEKTRMVSKGNRMLMQIDERTVMPFKIINRPDFIVECLGPIVFPSDVVRIDCGLMYIMVELVGSIVIAFGDSFDRLRVEDFEEIGKMPMNIAEIASTYLETLVLLTDGRLMCYTKRMGASDNSFQFIEGLPGKVVKVACGLKHSAIVLEDGRLMTSGWNCYGQLGRSYTDSYTLFFREVSNIPRNIVRVVCTHYNTFILLSDGVVMGCGNNDWGQLGLLDTTDRFELQIIKDIPKNVANISGGDCFSVIQLTDGTLLSCGYNYNNQLGFKPDIPLKKYTEKFTSIGYAQKNVGRVICGDYFLLIQQRDGNMIIHGLSDYRNKDNYQMGLHLA